MFIHICVYMVHLYSVFVRDQIFPYVLSHYSLKLPRSHLLRMRILFMSILKLFTNLSYSQTSIYEKLFTNFLYEKKMFMVLSSIF